MKLYQFAISHYCEKVRWALDFKGLSYQLVNLVPGLHLLTTRRLAAKTSVPILQDGVKIIQGSALILDYLEDKYPEPRLNPKNNSQLLKAAKEWEAFADTEIGPHLRRYYYHFILRNQKLTSFLLLQGTPWYGPLYFRIFFPLIRGLMRKSMNISEKTAQVSLKKLTDALDRLNLSLQDKNFLVGKNFSRADLCVASMLSPFCFPPEHDFNWPDAALIPHELSQLRALYEKTPVYQWVFRMYKNHRRQ